MGNPASQDNVAPTDLQEKSLGLELKEHERRTHSGHQRMNFLGTMTLGSIALAGGALASFQALQLPWWGPVGSLGMSIATFCLLLYISRPHMSLKEFLIGIFQRSSKGPKYGTAYAQVQHVTEEQILQNMGRAVDFYRWGIPRRERMYVIVILMLVVTVIPMALAMWFRFRNG